MGGFDIGMCLRDETEQFSEEFMGDYHPLVIEKVATDRNNFNLCVGDIYPKLSI